MSRRFVWRDADVTVENKKLTAKAETCPRCGASNYSLMPSDFETAKCAECGELFDQATGKPV